VMGAGNNRNRNRGGNRGNGQARPPRYGTR